MNRLSPPALLVVDAQAAIDDPRWGRRNNPEAERTIAALLGAWRREGAPVIHIHHLPTDPASTFQGGGGATKPEAALRGDEWLVWKSTPSAFADTPLTRLLATAGVRKLAICGFVTENSVEATARAAGTLGYETQVIADACATFDKTDMTGRLWRAEEVHALSLANLSGEYAEIAEASAYL
jgi:nicotinamidase-related amidase